jgi:predicted Fe-Mo cluster-binding NifX family protein
MIMRIALASSDGINVNLHFGKAFKFSIYELEGNKTNFLEIREVEKNPEEKHQWGKSLKIIRDCEVVICVQAGIKARLGLKKAGIKLLEDEGPVNEVLERYLKHEEFLASI